MRNRLNTLIEHSLARWTIRRHEKEISGKELYLTEQVDDSDSGQHDTIYHYMYLPKKQAKALVVVFQAYHRDGPRYNYVSSLAGRHVHRLYIKDDFIPGTGNYYLGHDGKFDMEPEICAMIRKFQKESGAEKLIFAGSSKGGAAAMNYGLMFPGSVMILGAPQYHLGTYMQDATKFHRALADIVGEPVTEEKIRMLDSRMEMKVRTNPLAKTQKVYLHCSKGDTTWERHCKDLYQDLLESGVQVETDFPDYEGHDHLKYYFPEFLIHSIQREE